MYCRFCRIEYPEGKKFCKECGSPLVEKETFCPKCRAPLTLKPDEKYCNECGALLTQPVQGTIKPKRHLSVTWVAIIFGCILAVLAGSIILYNYRNIKTPQRADGPPIPYEDYDVCSGEACAFGEWTVCQDLEIYKERDEQSPVVFQVTKGEKVNALTGVVIITKPGRAKVLKSLRKGEFEAVPGDIIYLLTYRGEGVYNFWFKGNVYIIGDLDLFNDDNLEILDTPETIDWVQIQNSQGQIGWRSWGRSSNELYFDYKYGCP